MMSRTCSRYSSRKTATLKNSVWWREGDDKKMKGSRRLLKLLAGAGELIALFQLCVKFSRAKGKNNPTKYIDRMFKAGILQVVQVVVLTVSKTINHRLENMGNDRGVSRRREAWPSGGAMTFPEKPFLKHQSLPTPENNKCFI